MAFQEHREDRRARYDRWVIVPASAAAITGLTSKILASKVFAFVKCDCSLDTPNLVAVVAASVALAFAIGFAILEDRRVGKRD